MYRIKTFNQIADKGLNRFQSDRYEVGPDVSDPQALLLRSHKLSEDDIQPGLKAIARAGAGVNNVPVSRCTEQGVVVFNTPGANANAVKELVLAGLLLGSRGILPGLSFVEELSGIEDQAELSQRLEKEKKRFKGNELQGKTLGIIGLGSIGSLVAETAIALGMEVLGHDPKLSVDAAWRLPNQVGKIENLSALLANSDYVSLHLPAVEATTNLINDDAVASMKPGLALLNFSRDEVIDSSAVINGLENGRLSRYITDFPRTELIGRDDVILMPHIGASTREAEENCATMAVDQLMDFLEHGNIRNSVNYPNLSLERVEDAAPGTRLAVTNRNLPGMLGKILAVLAEQNINVIDMMNKSRDEIAYTLIDLEREPDQATLDKVTDIENVIKAHLL